MIMIVRVGSSDLARSQAFYDAAFASLGFSGKKVSESMLMYANPAGGPRLVVATPRDGEATHANGGTIGISAPSKEAVDAFHAGGLANGGKSEGEPGPRERLMGAYAAYMRDPDGNKFSAIEQGTV